MPTTIESHVVKIVITCSISPDKKYNIGLIYRGHLAKSYVTYIYDCKKFDTERNLLEKETEDILKEFGLGHIVHINFQVLTGYLVDVPRQANQRMRIALGKFITSTGRLKADRQ